LTAVAGRLGLEIGEGDAEEENDRSLRVAMFM
jgi:hypothetical protein